MKTNLKHLSKSVMLLLMFAVAVYSQSITNTLGTSGVFTIKDASNTFLTLTQTTGQVNILRSLRIENTTSSTLGVLFKGADPFLHNYGTSNTFLGVSTGNFTMSGSYNTGIGKFSLFNLTSGNFNTALGMQSLNSNSVGSGNTAVGFNALYGNTSGESNTAIGKQSLIVNNIGYNNTGLGYQSLYSNQTGVNNTALGYNPLGNNVSGSFNTAVGSSVLTGATGSKNTALGYLAGSAVLTGSNLTLLGYGANPLSGSSVNEITLGDGNVATLRCNTQTISSLSDIRDKKNITDLTLGLDFLMKVKPRQFNWDKREWYEGNKSDGSKMKETFTAGFISQELDEAQTTENADWLNLVLKDNPEKLEATYGNLLPVMVKAIQELKAEKDELKNENNEMKQRLMNLEQAQNLLVSKLEKIKLDDMVIEQVKSGGVK
jgi:hypothetical protein